MKSKPCNTSVNNTTSIVIDYGLSSFELLDKKFSIYKTNISTHGKWGDYMPMIHNWARANMDHSYYFNSPTETFYILLPSALDVPELIFEERKLSFQRFDRNEKELHIIVKLMQAEYFKGSEFVSNNKFFIPVVRRGKSVFALKIDIRHNTYRKDCQEFWIEDKPIRLDPVTFDAYNKYYYKSVVYGCSIANNQAFYKHLKRDEITKDTLIFAEPKYEVDRVLIEWHSVDKPKNAKHYHLNVFCNNFVSFLRTYNIECGRKATTFAQVKTANDALLEITPFLYDIRANKKRPLAVEFNRFTKKPEQDLVPSDTILFISDYGPKFLKKFPSLNKKDTLKRLRNKGLRDSKAMIVNPNERPDFFDEFSDDDFENNRSKIRDSYLAYKDLTSKEIRCKLRATLNRLALQHVLMTKDATLLPNKSMFGCHFYHNEYILSVKENKLIIEKCKNTGELINKIGSVCQEADAHELYSKIKEFHRYDRNKFDISKLYLIFNNNFVGEVLELTEKHFYNDDDGRLDIRNRQEPKARFKSSGDDKLSTDWNCFLDNIPEAFTSFADLVRNYGRGEKGFLKCVFQARNETPFRKFLHNNTAMKNIKGLKEGGVYKTSKGIWFSREHQQYFVGRADDYNGYNQDTGKRIRQIKDYYGDINKDTFFQMLQYNFVSNESTISHSSYYVMPYPFRMIEMYDKNIHPFI